MAIKQDLGREVEGLQGEVARLQALLGGRDDEMAARAAEAEAAHAAAAELQVRQNSSASPVKEPYITMKETYKSRKEACFC